MMKKNIKNGFTLVELIVALGLFTAVMFIATGALLSIVAVNKKAQAQQSAINNLNFAVENMARNIRTGTSYSCQGAGEPPFPATLTLSDCTSSDGGSVFIFDAGLTGSPAYLNPEDNVWAYYLKDNQIWKATKLGSGSGGAEYYPVTAQEIYISNLKFYVDGAGTSDLKQPRVRIVVTGYAFVAEATGNPRRVDFSLQTTASQRLRGS